MNGLCLSCFDRNSVFSSELCHTQFPGTERHRKHTRGISPLRPELPHSFQKHLQTEQSPRASGFPPSHLRPEGQSGPEKDR